MKIQESAENYLEAILVLTQKNGQVRSIDVAHYTGFSKPSISRAVGLLRDNGYVSIDQNGLLGLTESGMQIATSIYERTPCSPRSSPLSAWTLRPPLRMRAASSMC